MVIIIIIIIIISILIFTHLTNYDYQTCQRKLLHPFNTLPHKNN